jgi:hypothetical protein|tara:strand:+ start:946 stop:1071 length:126 start_codon:yes stop_codon:yes gene_type:complete
MNVIGDDHYIYTTHESYHYTIVVVQDSIGKVVELQIEKYYE